MRFQFGLARVGGADGDAGAAQESFHSIGRDGEVEVLTFRESETGDTDDLAFAIEDGRTTAAFRDGCGDLQQLTTIPQLPHSADDARTDRPL